MLELDQLSVLWMLQMFVYTRSFRYDPDDSCQQTITTTTSAVHPSSCYKLVDNLDIDNCITTNDIYLSTLHRFETIHY